MLVAYSQADDKFYMKEDADSAGATRWDAISDPTNNGETIIDFDNAGEKTTLTTVYDAAGSFFKIDNTDADLANNTYLLDLEYTDDGQANADFLKCSDNNGDVKFSIQEEGNTAIAGTLGVTGAITSSVTLAGNPVLTANQATPGANGILFEGTTADAYEGLLAFPAASSDKTQTFQNVTGTVYCSGGTLIPVSGGGTGSQSLTDGGVLLGNGTGAVSVMAVLADGEMIVGDGTTDPVAESGATLRTSIGVGTGDSPQFTGVNVGHASDTTLARERAGDLTVEGNHVYRAGGTDVADDDVVDTLTITNISQVQDISATASEINTPLDGASVALTEFKELETIGATTISANQWALLGGVAETLGAQTEPFGWRDGPSFSGRVEYGCSFW